MVDRITAADLSYPVLTRKVGGGLRELLDVSKIRWRSMPIEFPKGEVKDLAARLNRGKPIYTTRVSAERGRYSSGMSVSSVLGDLKVTSVKHGVGVKTHPFLGELSPEHKKAIGNKPYDLVRLEKRAAPDYGALGFEKLPEGYLRHLMSNLRVAVAKRSGTPGGLKHDIRRGMHALHGVVPHKMTSHESYGPLKKHGSFARSFLVAFIDELEKITGS